MAADVYHFGYEGIRTAATAECQGVGEVGLERKVEFGL
jgi:hypothetical protein